MHYPTVLEKSGDYTGNSVLIEFGGRNITEPNEEHVVRPDIAEHVAGLEFPQQTVSVLSPAPTFWEKATLMHVECHREEFRTGAEHLSRHWYDLAMLTDIEHGHAAVVDRALLADVVKHKKVFYNAGYANYDACLVGQLRLPPADVRPIHALALGNLRQALCLPFVPHEPKPVLIHPHLSSSILTVASNLLTHNRREADGD